MYLSVMEYRSVSLRLAAVCQGVQKPYLESTRGPWGVQKYGEYRKMLLLRMVAVISY
jgi:hypothetical protein